MIGKPIAEAAQVLCIRPGTLRRLLREGAPVVSHGRRGRGHAVLVDPAQVQRWCSARDADDPALIRAALCQELAARLPEVLGDAAFDAFREIDSPAKRQFAKPLAFAWVFMACALLDHLREGCPGLPQGKPRTPESIERLLRIAD